MSMLLVRSCPYVGCKFEHTSTAATPSEVVEDDLRAHFDAEHPDWTVDEVEQLAATLLIERRRAAALVLIESALDQFGSLFDDEDEIVVGRWRFARR